MLDFMARLYPCGGARNYLHTLQNVTQDILEEQLKLLKFFSRLFVS